MAIMHWSKLPWTVPDSTDTSALSPQHQVARERDRTTRERLQDHLRVALRAEGRLDLSEKETLLLLRQISDGKITAGNRQRVFHRLLMLNQLPESALHYLLRNPQVGKDRYTLTLMLQQKNHSFRSKLLLVWNWQYTQDLGVKMAEAGILSVEEVRRLNRTIAFWRTSRKQWLALLEQVHALPESEQEIFWVLLEAYEGTGNPPDVFRTYLTSAQLA